jgi:hypothetical protein
MKKLDAIEGVEPRAADAGGAGRYATWRGPVAYLCRRILEARELKLPVWPAAEISRKAALAAASEVRLRRCYDPAADRRLAWLREVAAGCRAGVGVWPGEGGLEAAVRFLVYPGAAEAGGGR